MVPKQTEPSRNGEGDALGIPAGSQEDGTSSDVSARLTQTIRDSIREWNPEAGVLAQTTELPDEPDYASGDMLQLGPQALCRKPGSIRNERYDTVPHTPC